MAEKHCNDRFSRFSHAKLPMTEGLAMMKSVALRLRPPRLKSSRPRVMISETLPEPQHEALNCTLDKKLIIYARIAPRCDGKVETLFLGNYTIDNGTADWVFQKTTACVSNKSINDKASGDRTHRRVREMCDSLDEVDYVCLQHPISVRWLSLGRAVYAVKNVNPALVLELEETQRGNAASAKAGAPSGGEHKRCLETFERARDSFIQELIDSLTERFPAGHLSVISALAAIFDVERYPAIG
ncbi:hypothetical protein BaRGS_00010899 [Batillaria attramentaria]|uniref:Uncharacterized protein n=1 Tax=Batillaria attramentaria TaxID=370345 RepID=A0ABD0LEA7_9CAEN